MIRRDAGHDWLLITQNDHAAVAQQLATHFGNHNFAKASALQAIGLHDAGWPLHDDQPTLNPQHIPLDVFEVPRTTALKVWAASADRAAAVDPYSGLLVSLHSLSLSVYATSPTPQKTEQFDVEKMQEIFAINKFQHREVERQEQLRKSLNFNTQLILKHGLTDPQASAKDDQLRFDFHLLQAMDLMSLCLCCTELPQQQSKDVLRSPSGKAIKFSFQRNQSGELIVDPWPFDVNKIELTVPCRRMPVKAFESVNAFRVSYAEASNDILSVRTIQR